MTKNEIIKGHMMAAEDLVRQALVALDAASESAGRSEEGRIIATAKTDLEKTEAYLSWKRMGIDDHA